MKRWDGHVWMRMGAGALVIALGCSPDEEPPETMTGPGEPIPGIGFPGLNESVLAMTTYGTDLVAGGTFRIAGEDSANGIARWDGSRWSPLGDGLGGDDVVIAAVAELGGTLYVGGDFIGAGETDARNLAAWDGTAWSRVNDQDGASGRVDAALPLMDGIFFGGDFETIGPLPALNVVWYDGDQTWEPLGPPFSNGVNGPVRALGSYEGSLVVAGEFTQAAGNPATNIARWDGSAWSQLDAGLDGPVFAIAEYEGDLYASGIFGEAIGPWQSEDIVPSGSGEGEHVSMTFFGSTPYVAYFDPATESIKVAEQDGDGNWSSSVVASGGIGPYVSIASTSTGGLWVAYYDAVNRYARYGKRLAGTTLWQTGIIDSTGAVGENCDIAVGGNDVPVACYDDMDNDVVRVAEPPVGGGVDVPWITVVPDTASAAYKNRDGAIVVDSGLRVHVVYYDSQGQNPRYACRGCVEEEEGEEDVWITEPFHTGSSDQGNLIDIALDPSDRPYVAYYVNSFPRRVLTGARDQTLGWTTTSFVATVPEGFTSVSIVVDPFTAEPTVAYEDSTNGGALTLATRSGTSWNYVPLDFGTGVGEFVAMGLSGGRDIALAYFDGSTETLRLAARLDSRPVRRLARYDGDSWQSVGGLNWWARDLEVYSGRLFAAGTFTEVSGIAADGLASWNGSAWSVVSTGSDDFVWNLVVHSGRLIAGGGFTQFQGRPSNYIAIVQ